MKIICASPLNNTAKNRKGKTPSDVAKETAIGRRNYGDAEDYMKIARYLSGLLQSAEEL